MDGKREVTCGQLVMLSAARLTLKFVGCVWRRNAGGSAAATPLLRSPFPLTSQPEMTCAHT